jgi:hypothetical protein
MSGMPVSEGVNEALAILLLPINAALNPCLYLISKILEDRRLQREVRLMHMLKSRLMLR